MNHVLNHVMKPTNFGRYFSRLPVPSALVCLLLATAISADTYAQTGDARLDRFLATTCSSTHSGYPEYVEFVVTEAVQYVRADRAKQRAGAGWTTAERAEYERGMREQKAFVENLAKVDTNHTERFWTDAETLASQMFSGGYAIGGALQRVEVEGGPRAQAEYAAATIARLQSYKKRVMVLRPTLTRCSSGTPAGVVVREQDQAALGDPREEHDLGMRYYHGQNFEQAMFWLKKSAEHGFAQAQYNVGVFYDKGIGVPVDDEEAAKWFRMAADQGDGKAAYNLGVLYTNGTGVPRDNIAAKKWFDKAAEKGVQ